MGTEHPDTERMHRLFDDALADADLTGDVVPGVLAGYEHKVKVRRYRSAGVALAVLAAAGITISALPRGGATVNRPAPATTIPGPDYCVHEHWATMALADPPGFISHLSTHSAAEQANCEALRAALHATVPDAQLMPNYDVDLALDPRLDQTLVTKVYNDFGADPTNGRDEQMKYFGSELKYLAVHPEDPANVYTPDTYSLILGGGRDGLDIRSTFYATYNATNPVTFVGTKDSADCGKMPAALKKDVHFACTPVGTADGWYGALWREFVDPDNWVSTAVLTNSQGKYIWIGDGSPIDAWYREGVYEGTVSPGSSSDQKTKWINRWTGQTFVGGSPPDSHAVTQQQLARFLDSAAFQKYADSYSLYAASQPTR